MKSILTTLIVSALGLSVLAEPAPKKTAATKDAEPPAAARKAVEPLTPTEKTKLLKLLKEGDTAALTGLPGIGEGGLPGLPDQGRGLAFIELGDLQRVLHAQALNGPREIPRLERGYPHISGYRCRFHATTLSAPLNRHACKSSILHPADRPSKAKSFRTC